MMTDFIVVGNGNALTTKEIFPLIKENKLWLGNKAFSGGMDMLAGKNYDATKCKHPKYDERNNLLINVMMCTWFTNIDHTKRNTPLDLYKKYNAEEYPKYDNYDAIEVDNVNRIPCNYDGVMGVPITFLDRYCPSQFEIVGASEQCGTGFAKGIFDESSTIKHPLINGNKIYSRLFIRKKKEERE